MLSYTLGKDFIVYRFAKNSFSFTHFSLRIIFDLFDTIRNRPGTGIYGQEEQVTFWLSENHRAMSTFREPIFFASFLLPLTFIALCSRSRLVYPTAIISGCIIGLTRSDLIFFTAASVLGLMLIAFISKKLYIKSLEKKNR